METYEFSVSSKQARDCFVLAKRVRLRVKHDRCITRNDRARGTFSTKQFTLARAYHTRRTRVKEMHGRTIEKSIVDGCLSCWSTRIQQNVRWKTGRSISRQINFQIRTPRPVPSICCFILASFFSSLRRLLVFSSSFLVRGTHRAWFLYLSLLSLMLHPSSLSFFFCFCFLRVYSYHGEHVPSKNPMSKPDWFLLVRSLMIRPV